MISLQDKAIKLEITTYDLQRGTNCLTVFTYSANTNPKPQCGRKHRECAHLTKKDDYLRMCFYYEVIPVIIFFKSKKLAQTVLPDVIYTWGGVLEGAEDVIYTWGRVTEAEECLPVQTLSKLCGLCFVVC